MNKIAKILFVGPFQKFFGLFASSSGILLLTAVAAFIWANSPWSQSYHDFWHTPLTIGLGRFSLSESLHFWINDGLMAIFFFLVGLEIKRELLVGELSTPKQALFPVLAAGGGMLLPGLLYVLVNPPESAYFQGWGIPTVTDIAFALGVLSILGDRVPVALKVFLTALAIVDDLGAVLIIALFYTKEIDWYFLSMAGTMLLALFAINRFGLRRPLYYAAIGLLLWCFTLFSGVHTTIAGVLLALAIPANSRIDAKNFCENGLETFNRISDACKNVENCSILTEKEHQASVQNIETLCEEAQAPLQKLEHSIQPWVNYGIMPLFALANAGVTINWQQGFGQSLGSSIGLGVLLGLVLGKQIGITLFTWLGVRLKLIDLPARVSWAHIYGVSWLGGIGFTMSLFIAGLAFNGNGYTDIAKISILTASLISGFIGWLILNVVLPRADAETGPA